MTGKIGRNDPCPCGSGKKYKNCCGKENDRVVAVGGENAAVGNRTGSGLIPGFYVVQAEADGGLVAAVLRDKEQVQEMPGSRFEKFVLRNPGEGWGSIFISPGYVLVMADNPYLGKRLQGMVEEGTGTTLSWGQPGLQMDFIAVAEEMMVDKFIQKWLTSPDPALNNLTPWQSVKIKPLRSRLSKLIEEWEKAMQEKSGGVGYVYPFSWLRSQLGLTGNEDLTPVTREEVDTYRDAALVRDDIGDYSWLSDDYAQVFYMADMLLRDGGWQNRKHRAFVLYLWNEFTTLEQPDIDEFKIWAAVIKLMAAHYPQDVPAEALDQVALMAEADRDVIEECLGRVYEHFDRFPLKMDEVCYFIDMEWDSLDIKDQIKLYRDLMEAMLEMVSMGEEEQQHYERSLESFLQNSFTADSDELANLYGEMFTQWYLMDARVGRGDLSVAQIFERVMKELGPAEKTALENLLASYISIYKVTESDGLDCMVRDLLMKKDFQVISLRRDPMCRGDFFLARLVPVEGGMVPINGWIPISSVMVAKLVKIAERMAKEAGHARAGSQAFLKTNGLALVAAFSYLLSEQARRFGEV